MASFSVKTQAWKERAEKISFTQNIYFDPTGVWLPRVFVSISVFFRNHSRITGLQGKGEGIPAIPYYHFHPLHKRLDISRVITAESLRLHTASSRTQTGKLWFPSAIC